MMEELGLMFGGGIKEMDMGFENGKGGCEVMGEMGKELLVGGNEILQGINHGI